MNFKEATDILFSGAKHDELAAALGVSVASIRQARLSPSANAHREPPADWEKAVMRLAEARVAEYLSLIEGLCSGESADTRKVRPKTKKQ